MSVQAQTITVRLENTANGHYKQYTAQLDVETATVVLNWGKIGCTSHSKLYQFETGSDAHNFFWKKIDEKRAKGYRRTK